MAESKSTWNLIAVPALITLAITIIRLVGELQHWPSPLFSNQPGGGGAIVGISWLPILFGPWFAVKLASSGDGPASSGKSIGFAILALAVLFGSMAWAQSMFAHPSWLLLAPFALMLASAFIPGIAWKALGRTLFAYALAARIPVLVVMFIAMSGNGGTGWGTHYDAISPIFAQASFARKYLYEALIPQATLWMGWTVVVGAVFGTVVAAVARRGKPAAQPAG
ncbi:MAG TPA: hypothetical protein VFM21_04200 [Terriglobia bacterium]|nr:hypothetical protein [Terriglobia bacterium]